ncbi:MULTISPECIES: hypothetical protein [unclassified Sulfitobacter]|uniref:hypothetical protein n=1 Tax=unclassified Sulfitobacter TaxID=196795 RepID=UPI0007C32D60|nr:MULTISPECIES: hypothetical protein [unclassified Sulfitobacter]KZY04265.1 hypothetical protein A3721_02835 [Sulfitobacter sp. HI0023]KZY26765.1 hypothetical protein A3728_15025 [Sulfitobacter sp. HI0040]KZZ67142.1 hypothetical protein A3764_02770 [Sulfitobacter sp. HI0129]
MAHKITQGWAAPAFWKRWLISRVAVYPPLVVLAFAFRALFRDIPTLLSLFLIAACLTALTHRVDPARAASAAGCVAQHLITSHARTILTIKT